MLYKSKVTRRTAHATAIAILVLTGIAPVSIHAMDNNSTPTGTGWGRLVVASLSGAHTTLLSSHPLSSHQQTPSQQNVSFGSSSAQQPISPTTQTPCHAEKYAFDLEITQREQTAQQSTLAHDTRLSSPSAHTTPQNTISTSRATPHQCPECGKSFRYQDLLKQHGDVHKEKTIHCPVCPNTRFTSKQRLKSHIKTQKHQENLRAAEERDANSSQNTQDQQQRDRLDGSHATAAKKRKVTHGNHGGGGGGGAGGNNEVDDE